MLAWGLSGSSLMTYFLVRNAPYRPRPCMTAALNGIADPDTSTRARCIHICTHVHTSAPYDEGWSRLMNQSYGVAPSAILRCRDPPGRLSSSWMHLVNPDTAPTGSICIRIHTKCHSAGAKARNPQPSFWLLPAYEVSGGYVFVFFSSSFSLVLVSSITRDKWDQGEDQMMTPGRSTMQRAEYYCSIHW
jgi:hypothetical protein